MMKTNDMDISGNRQSVITQGNMQIANTVFNKVDVASFVGLNIDQHLTWTFHIEHVNKCVRIFFRILSKLRHFVPRAILLCYINL